MRVEFVDHAVVQAEPFEAAITASQSRVTCADDGLGGRNDTTSEDGEDGRTGAELGICRDHRATLSRAGLPTMVGMASQRVDLGAALHARGLRMTPQRELVLAAVRDL